MFHRQLALRAKNPFRRQECLAMESVVHKKDLFPFIEFNKWVACSDWKEEGGRMVGRMLFPKATCDCITSIFVDHTAGRWPCRVVLDIGGMKHCYLHMRVQGSSHVVREFATGPVGQPGFMLMSILYDCRLGDQLPRILVRTQTMHPHGSCPFLDRYFFDPWTYLFFEATAGNNNNITCVRYADGLMAPISTSMKGPIETVEDVRQLLRQVPHGKQNLPFYKWMSLQELHSLTDDEWPHLVSSLCVVNPHPYAIHLAMLNKDHEYVIPPGPHVFELFWSEMYLPDREDFYFAYPGPFLSISIRVGWLDRRYFAPRLDVLIHMQEDPANSNYYSGIVYHQRSRQMRTRFRSPAATETLLTWLWVSRYYYSLQKHPLYDFHLPLKVAEYL